MLRCPRSSMDRVPDFESDGWAFESPRGHSLLNPLLEFLNQFPFQYSVRMNRNMNINTRHPNVLR